MVGFGGSDVVPAEMSSVFEDAPTGTMSRPSLEVLERLHRSGDADEKVVHDILRANRLTPVSVTDQHRYLEYRIRPYGKSSGVMVCFRTTIRNDQGYTSVRVGSGAGFTVVNRNAKDIHRALAELTTEAVLPYLRANADALGL